MVQFLRCVFFFQAEDGIRDLVRSRGLGDVYKRQLHKSNVVPKQGLAASWVLDRLPDDNLNYIDGVGAVSYTHLTLPTSDLV